MVIFLSVFLFKTEVYRFYQYKHYLWLAVFGGGYLELSMCVSAHCGSLNTKLDGTTLKEGKIYRLRVSMEFILKDRKEVAENTMACFFQPPSDFTFTAGQNGDFTIAASDGAKMVHTFSFASSPKNDQVMITTRLRGSAFKERLKQLPLESTVEVEGPMGSFTLLKDTSLLTVFLVGGIGITPVRSMVEYATQESLPHKMIVFYSNKNRAETAFLGDFENWERQNPNLTFMPTLTEEKPDDWPYESGRIDAPMLRKHIDDLHNAVYYLVGPPKMTSAMREITESLDIDELKIKSEDFSGY
jgi:ferredoxin-NADP reductase